MGGIGRMGNFSECFPFRRDWMGNQRIINIHIMITRELAVVRSGMLVHCVCVKIQTLLRPRARREIPPVLRRRNTPTNQGLGEYRAVQEGKKR